MEAFDIVYVNLHFKISGNKYTLKIYAIKRPNANCWGKIIR